MASTPGPEAPPRFSLGRSLLFSAILVGSFFALVEIAVRLVGVGPAVEPRLIVRAIDTDISLPFMGDDPDLFWSPTPGYRGVFMGKPVTINRLGLRGAEVAVPKPKGTRRVLCFGDSITFGYGVGDDETYPRALGLLLADKGVEVVNAGVTGYTSHQVLRLLKRLDRVVEADLATFCIGWNDSNKRPVDDREYDRRIRRVQALEGPLDHLYLYRALKGAYLRSTVLGGLTRKRGGPPVTGHRASLDQYRENLGAVVAECRSHGIRPVFVSLPHRKKAGEPRDTSDYAQALEEAGRALGVSVLDVSELGLRTPLESNAGYFIDSLHMTPEGNALMARILARQLLEGGLL